MTKAWIMTKAGFLILLCVASACKPPSEAAIHGGFDPDVFIKAPLKERLDLKPLGRDGTAPKCYADFGWAVCTWNDGTVTRDRIWN